MIRLRAGDHTGPRGGPPSGGTAAAGGTAGPRHTIAARRRSGAGRWGRGGVSVRLEGRVVAKHGELFFYCQTKNL